MIATLLEPLGSNSNDIWIFAGGVLACLLVVALVGMGVAFIRRLLDAAGGPRS